MLNKIVNALILVSLAVVKSEPPSTDYGTPLGAPISSYGTPNHNVNDNHHEYGEPKSYEFGYQVKDDYTGNNYNRKESSDGNQVRGEYRVQLPDGRTQIVTYYADWQTGFHADVKYEGTAQYPEQYNTYQGGYNNNHHQTPSNQYGPANYAAQNDYNNYQNNNGYNNGESATSSVSIKDYSSGGTAYNGGNNNNNGYNYNNGFNNNNHLDSYSGNAGYKSRPSNEYGAP